LNLVLYKHTDGQLHTEPRDWSQQLIGPYQPWYTDLGGKDNVQVDRVGVPVIEPLRTLRTPFAPPSPRVTNYRSAHVRDYCLYLRFLVDTLVARIAEVPSPAPVGNRKRIQVPTVAECRIEPTWTPDGYIVHLGTKATPRQFPLASLPVHVLRVLRHVGDIPVGEGESVKLAKDDRRRFGEWVAVHFDIVDGSKPLLRVKKSWVKAWYAPRPNQP
jgi:hypothetical protein